MAVTFVDRVNTLVVESAGDPARFANRQNDPHFREYLDELCERTSGNQAWLWISVTEHLSQKLRAVVGPVSQLDLCKATLGTVGFAMLMVAGLVEMTIRTLLALIILPFAWAASKLGAMDEKTFTFLQNITFHGGSTSTIAAVVAFAYAIADLVFVPILLLSCGQNHQANPQENQ